MPTQLSGLVCAYNPATQGSSPKHSIYSFIMYSIFALFGM